MKIEELISQDAEYQSRFENTFLSVYGFSFAFYKDLLIAVAQSNMFYTNRNAFAQAVREYENRILTIKQILL
jgi:hypothetical protein